MFAIAIAAFFVGLDEKADLRPSGSSTTLNPEPGGSPTEKNTASTTAPEYSSTPPPPTPLDSSAPAYHSEPGNSSTTADGLPRDTRDNDSYYDGNYDNDDDWHREHGNPDEYYDGNYDNDDDYHRKYGRN
ncbi:hypothetical protein ACWD5B_04115 [Streptomyces tanashiensis]